VFGFNLKRMSTNGRADEALREFDCKGRVIGADVNPVPAVVVVVVVGAVEVVATTIRSVGGLI